MDYSFQSLPMADRSVAVSIGVWLCMMYVGIALTLGSVALAVQPGARLSTPIIAFFVGLGLAAIGWHRAAPLLRDADA